MSISEDIAVAKEAFAPKAVESQVSVAEAKEALFNPRFEASKAAALDAFRTHVPDPEEIISDENNVIRYANGKISVRMHNGQLIHNVLEENIPDILAVEEAKFQDKRSGVKADVLGNPDNPIRDSAAAFINTGTDIVGKLTNAAVSTGREFLEIGSSSQTLTEEITKYNRQAEATKHRKKGAVPTISDNLLLDYRQLKADMEENNQLTPAQSEFLSSEEFELIESLQARVDESNKIDHTITEATQKVLPSSTADDLKASQAYHRVAKEQGTFEAVKSLLTNDWKQLVKQGFESIPYMVAFTIGGPIAQTSIMVGLSKAKARENTDAFIAENGRDPSQEEQLRINMWSTASTLAEKFGDTTALRALPVGKLGRSKGIIDSVLKGTPKSISSLVNKTKLVSRPAIALAGEAQSGAATSIADKLAIKGELTKEDIPDIAFDATAEAIGVAGGIGGIAAGNLSLNTAKASIAAAVAPSKAQQRRGKIEDKLKEVKRALHANAPVTVGQLAESQEEFTELTEIFTQLEIANSPINEDFDKDKADTENVFFNTLYEANITKGDTETVAADKAKAAINEGIAEAEERKAVLTEKLSKPASESQTAEYTATLQENKNKLQTLLNENKFSNKQIKKAKAETAKAAEADKPVTDTSKIEDKEFDELIGEVDKSTGKKAAELLLKVSKRTVSITQEAAIALAKNKVLKKLGSKTLDLADRTLKDIGIFGSSGVESNNEELSNAKKVAKTAADVELLDAKIAANDLAEELRAREIEEKKDDKTIKDVNDNVLSGVSTRWRGLDTYQNRITEILNDEDMDSDLAQTRIDKELGDLNRHAGNMQRKAAAFQKAYEQASETNKEVLVKAVSVEKRSRHINYEIVETTDANRKNKFVTSITKKESGKLVKTIQLEAAYGKEVQTVARTYKKSSFSEQSTQQRLQTAKDKATVRAIEDIGKDTSNREKTLADQEEIEALQNPTGTNPVKTSGNFSEFSKDELIEYITFAEARLNDALRDPNLFKEVKDAIGDLLAEAKALVESDSLGEISTPDQKENQDVQPILEQERPSKTPTPVGTSTGEAPVLDKTTPLTPVLVEGVKNSGNKNKTPSPPAPNIKDEKPTSKVGVAIVAAKATLAKAEKLVAELKQEYKIAKAKIDAKKNNVKLEVFTERELEEQEALNGISADDIQKYKDNPSSIDARIAEVTKEDENRALLADYGSVIDFLNDNNLKPAKELLEKRVELGDTSEDTADALRLLGQNTLPALRKATKLLEEANNSIGENAAGLEGIEYAEPTADEVAFLQKLKRIVEGPKNTTKPDSKADKTLLAKIETKGKKAAAAVKAATQALVKLTKTTPEDSAENNEEEFEPSSADQNFLNENRSDEVANDEVIPTLEETTAVEFDPNNFIETTKGTLPTTITEKQLRENKKKFAEKNKLDTSKEGIDKLVAESSETILGLLGKSFHDLVKLRKDKDGKDLNSVFTMPTEVFGSEKSLTQALLSLKLSPKSAAIMSAEYFRFNKKYLQIALDKEKQRNAAGDLIFPNGLPAGTEPLALLHVDGKLPPQLVFAMAISMMEFVNRNPTNTARRGHESEAFLYSSYAELSDNELAEIQPIGYGYHDVVDDVSKGVASYLKISSKDTESSGYFDNLITAFGLAAIQIEHGPEQSINDIAKIKQIDEEARLHIEHHIWEFSQDPVNKDRKFNKGDKEQFKHIKIHTPTEIVEEEEIGEDGNPINVEIETNLPFKFSEEKITALNEIGKTFDNKVKDSYPLSAPQSSVDTEIKNSNGKVPNEVSEVLQTLQNIAWTAADVLTIISEVSGIPGGRKVLNTLMGVVPIHKRAHESIQLADTAKNLDKTSALDELLDAFQNGKLEKFYFKYRLQIQGRVLMEGKINPQQSKVSRYTLRAYAPREYNDKNIHLFKQAVAFSFGVSVDKQDLEDTEADFNTIINNKNVQAAVAALPNLKDPVQAAIFLENIPLIMEMEEFSGNISLMTGLQALAQYMPGGNIPEKSTPFISDIMLEIDGMANGHAISAAQFPAFGTTEETTSILEQVGTYEVKKGEQARHDTQRSDVYTDLTSKINEYSGVDVALEYDDSIDPGVYKNRNTALTALYKDLQNGGTRDLVKYPFLIFNYGGGIPSISKGVAKKAIASIYRQFNDINLEYQNTNGEAKAHALEKLKIFAEHLETLGAFSSVTTNSNNKFKSAEHFIKSITSKILIKGNRPENLYFNDTVMINAIAGVVAPRFDAGLNAMLGGTGPARAAVIQSGEILHALFMEHYNKALNIAKTDPKHKYFNRKSLTEREVFEFIENNELLLKVFPQYKGPMMTKNERAFMDLTNREFAKEISNAENVKLSYTNEKGSSSSTSSVPRQRKFVAPGVSSLIRLIINIDSAILLRTLSKNPNVLALHDAVMGDPGILEEMSEDYGDFYVEISQNTNILQIIRDQVKSVLAISDASIRTKASTWLVKNAYANKGKKEKNNLGQFLTDIDSALADIVKIKADRKAAREKAGLIEKSNQLFIALQDPASERKNKKDSKAPTIVTKLKKEVKKTVKEKRSTKDNGEVTITLSDGTTGPTIPAVIVGNLAVHKSNKLNTKKGTPIVDVIGKGRSYRITHIPSGMSFPLPSNFVEEHGKNTLLKLEAVNAAHTVMEALIATGINISSKDMSQAKIKLVEKAWIAALAKDSDTAINDFISSNETIQGVQTLNDDAENFSSLENLPRQNAEETLVTDLDASNATSLFNQMSDFSADYYASPEDQKEHTSALNKVLNVLKGGMDATTQVRMTLEEIDGITQGQYDSIRDNLRVSLSKQMPLSLHGQSPQEVYVHEVLHAMTYAAIRDEPLIAKRIEQIYNRTKKELDSNGKYEVFLEGIPKDKRTKEDIDIAKIQYNYLFDNPTKAAHKLHEFLAYSVTNRALSKYLSNKSTSLPVRNKGIKGQLLHIVDIIVDTFESLIHRKRYKRAGQANAHQEMLAVTEHLVAIQSKHESSFRKFQKKLYKTQDEADKKIQEFAIKQSERIARLTPKSKFQELLQDAAGITGALFSENVVAQQTREKLNLVLNKSMRAIANEIGSGALSEKMIEQLLHAKVNISKARQESERFTTEWFNGIWKSVEPGKPHTMDIYTREALTAVLLQADISSLRHIGVSHKDIAKFLGNPNSIKVQKADIRRRLGNMDLSHRALKYAEELGEHLALGNTGLNQAHMNAHTIAKTEMTNSTERDAELLDAYASLSALQKLDPRKLAAVNKLAINEFEADGRENGIIDMIDSHILYKRKSRKHLFEDNPNQMVKGYIVERVDNLTSIRTGTAADAKQMKRDGFTEAFPLGELTDVKQAHDTLYVSYSIPEVPDVSGIMSTTNQRNMGTTLTEIFSKDPAFQDADGGPNFIAIEAEIKKFHKKETARAKNLTSNRNIKIRPTRDDGVNITDYRVMMDHQTKKSLLRPDMEIQNVFAHMHSVYVDRKNTTDNDKQVVESLVHEQSDMLKSHKELFIDFLDPKEGYIDRFRKLPREVREYIKDFAKDGKFMIRADIVDKVFGYKATDFSQLKILQHPSMGRVKRYAGIMHYMLRQIVGYGKDRIVVAMPKVVFGNVVSNIAQLSMRNIPLTFTMHKTIEGFQEYQKYQKDTDELRRVVHKMESKGLDENSLEGKRRLELEARIEGNKIHRMSTAGLNSLIVEDVNEAQNDGYFNKIRRTLRVNPRFNTVSKRTPKYVGEIAATMFMSRSSVPYQLSRKFVQLNDFLARYVMIEHMTKVQNLSFDVAMHKSLDAFVVFDEALVPTLELLESTGAVSFLSYFLRNQRSAKQLVQANPVGVGIAAGIQHATGIPTLGNVNASWLAGDFSPNLLQLDDLWDEATNVTGAELLRDMYNAIFD